MKDVSLIGYLTAFHLLILGATFGCFALIGFKIDGILMFELVGSLAGIMVCTAIWLTQYRRVKYRPNRSK